MINANNSASYATIAKPPVFATDSMVTRTEQDLRAGKDERLAVMTKLFALQGNEVALLRAQPKLATKIALLIVEYFTSHTERMSEHNITKETLWRVLDQHYKYYDPTARDLIPEQLQIQCSDGTTAINRELFCLATNQDPSSIVHTLNLSRYVHLAALSIFKKHLYTKSTEITVTKNNFESLQTAVELVQIAHIGRLKALFIKSVEKLNSCLSDYRISNEQELKKVIKLLTLVARLNIEHIDPKIRSELHCYPLSKLPLTVVKNYFAEQIELDFTPSASDNQLLPINQLFLLDPTRRDIPLSQLPVEPTIPANQAAKINYCPPINFIPKIFDYPSIKPNIIKLNTTKLNTLILNTFKLDTLKLNTIEPLITTDYAAAAQSICNATINSFTPAVPQTSFFGSFLKKIDGIASIAKNVFYKIANNFTLFKTHKSDLQKVLKPAQIELISRSPIQPIMSLTRMSTAPELRIQILARTIYQEYLANISFNNLEEVVPPRLLHPFKESFYTIIKNNKKFFQVQKAAPSPIPQCSPVLAETLQKYIKGFSITSKDQLDHVAMLPFFPEETVAHIEEVLISEPIIFEELEVVLNTIAMACPNLTSITLPFISVSPIESEQTFIKLFNALTTNYPKITCIHFSNFGNQLHRNIDLTEELYTAFKDISKISFPKGTTFCVKKESSWFKKINNDKHLLNDLNNKLLECCLQRI